MRAGSVIAGKYRVTEPLGRGGMGAVWRAEHVALGTPLAVKLMDPEIAATSEGIARFSREARAAAALRSPHVVHVFDFGSGVSSCVSFPAIHRELARRAPASHAWGSLPQPPTTNCGFPCSESQAAPVRPVQGTLSTGGQTACFTGQSYFSSLQ
jgi:serine/threonine protein kinase